MGLFDQLELITGKIMSNYSQAEASKELAIPLLQPMETAPKDGTRIVIVWYDENRDCRNYNIREAWWWKPTHTHQWESGARPHWEYISDSDSCRTISSPNGWMPKPELLEA